uniref:Uncharacterized protein n=1 Tax=Arundo donax TaxID=35708 RepID=A0A0A9BS50_ARUDO
MSITLQIVNSYKHLTKACRCVARRPISFF